MNRSQRHVVAIALAAVCLVAGAVADRAWIGRSNEGWFMYAPGSTSPLDPSNDAETAIRRVGVWLAVIGVWTAVAWRLYRDSE